MCKRQLFSRAAGFEIVVFSVLALEWYSDWHFRCNRIHSDIKAPEAVFLVLLQG
jgi:hypothetical protein